VAAATCASIILVLKLEGPTVGCGSAVLATVVLDSAAAALLAVCSCVFGEPGGSGTRDAGGSAFAAIVVDFAGLLARRTPRRTWADDDFSVFRALADWVSFAVELTLNVANLIGAPAVRSRQANPFVPVHDPEANCSDGWRLQPTKLAASAPIRSVFKQSSLRG
jgi:hypothetical protein